MKHQRVFIVGALLSAAVIIRLIEVNQSLYTRQSAAVKLATAKAGWKKRDVAASNYSDAPRLESFEYIRSNLVFISMLEKQWTSTRHIKRSVGLLYRNTTIPVRYSALDGLPASDAWRGQITVKFYGRLGNNMYQYSALYAAAVHHGMRIVLPDRCMVAKLFKLNATLVTSKRPGRDWAPLIEYQPEDPRLEHLDSTRDIELVGPYRSLTYWHNMVAQVLRQFTFVDSVERESVDFLHKV